MSQETVRKLQMEQLDILAQVDKVCKDHNLTYFAVGGTALGAVRHRGFIPWDDDVDIAMPRADYDRFLEIAARELPEKYRVQHFSTEPATPFYFAKVRKSGTLFVEYPVKDLPIHQGIFIDIFPFDALSDVAWQRKLHYRLSRITYRMFSCKVMKSRNDPRMEALGIHKRGLKYYARRALHLLVLPIPTAWLYRLMDRCLRWFNGRDTESIGYPVSKYLVMAKKDLYPIQSMAFEGTTVPMAANYEVYLKHKYGNYMKLPPEDKRYGHLPYRVEFETEE